MAGFPIKGSILEQRKNFYGSISIVLSFMLLTFITVKFLAPDLGSNAATQNASETVGPYTLSMSNDSVANVEITPTASQQIFTTTNNLTLSNSCSKGATISISTNSTTSNDLTRNGTDSATKTIPATTGSSLLDNTWGFSTDGGTTYSPVPMKGGTTTYVYGAVEAATNKNIPVQFGIKASSSLPSGTYTTDVVYTLMPKPGCLTYGVTWDMNGGTAKSGATYPTTINWGNTIDLSQLTPTRTGYTFTGWTSGSSTFTGNETTADPNPSGAASITMVAQWQMLTMQTFNKSTLANVGDSVTLKDERDGNIYTVKKLADGNVWMTENLRLIDKTISSADSNLPSGSSFTIPASNLSSFTDSYNTNSAYLDSTYGGYYNFYTATAGWGTNSVTSGNAPKDICPKGWRLPTGGDSGEFQALYNQYNSSALMRGDPGFILSGGVNNGSVYNQGSRGYYWSSSVNSATHAYYLSLPSSNVYPAYYYNKYYGFSVRCVAKETPMQTFDKSTLVNVGDSIRLVDERDGNFYTVKKLADGNVWMTENLRIAGKTITSTDSNLPAGETYTVPASDLSSFTESYNTNSAYLDSTYGGYYNFYTATAGWGTNSVTSGNAPKDICPKGWRLPTGGSSGEFKALYNRYFSSVLIQGVPNFVLSGYVVNGSVRNQGSHGGYWSSSVYDANGAYKLYLGLGNSDVNPANSYDKYYGFSVRCVAKETMQTFDKSTLANVGDSISLKDERDGNFYTVKKLADGNVWMTENLRIAGKTITSTDSNLPAGETYTVPASDLSNITLADSAYLDSTYGGYYNFSTATAGWGGTTSGNSPKDICPKGWRLPTGGDSGEFKNLYNQYSSGIAMIDDAGLVFPGYVGLDDSMGYQASVFDQGSRGIFWSSTAYNDSIAYILSLNSSNANPATLYNYFLGVTIRCMAD